MERIWTTQLAEHVGEQIRLAGWLHRVRGLGGINFLLIRDAKGLAQAVVEDPATIQLLSTLPAESVIEIEGLVVSMPQGPEGVEVRNPQLKVIAPAEAPPPFDLFRPSIAAAMPTLLDHAAVALRHPRRRAHFRVAAASVAGFRETLQSLDFVEVHTPKIVAAATETGANLFGVEYFGRRAYLAQSPQLYKQILVGVFERVFEIGPVFRAEPHDTPRHINQYTSLDAEMGFIESHHTVMDVLTRVIAGLTERVREQSSAEVELLGIRLPSVPDDIPSLNFSLAQSLISEGTGWDLTSELDLAPAHEAWLSEWALREYDSEFLFVEGFPLEKRPFYTHPDLGRPGYSFGFDLLFRGWEIVTGGQRLHRYDDYLKALEARGEDRDVYAGYLEAFRHGMPPHGGFAIGLERWVSRLTEVANVRETTLFPRDMNRLKP